MNRETLESCLRAQPAALDSYPFGERWQVFKVKGKMFAVIAEQAGRLSVNLKCDPVEAQMLRDIFAEVTPGYHMNKRHWNTVYLDGELPDGEVERMVENSWALVVRGLKKSEREALQLVRAQQQDSASS